MATDQLWKWIGAQGLLTLGFGLMALLWPGVTAGALLVLLVVFGIGSTIAGAVMATRRQDAFLMAAVAAYGLGAIGLALFGLLLPRYAILVCLIAVLLQTLGGGLALIGYGLWLRGRGGKGWPVIAMGAVVALVGTAVWFLPPAASGEVMARVGGYALAQGALLSGAGVLLRLTGGAHVLTAPTSHTS